MMKQILASMMVLSFTGLVNAAVTLQIEQEIKVEEINGQAIKSGLIRSNLDQYQLTAGTNELEVSYYQYFDAEDGIGAHDIVRSAPVFIKTPILQDNQTYRLALMKMPQNNDQAKQFAKQPIFGLYNSQNELLMTQAGAVQSRQSIISAFLGDQEQTFKSKNMTNKQPEASYTVAAKIIPEQKQAETTNKATSASLYQLINTWQNASKEDRQKFMMWLAE